MSFESDIERLERSIVYASDLAALKAPMRELLRLIAGHRHEVTVSLNERDIRAGDAATVMTGEPA